jgi:light-regulated signal transduction histidine kinase (bacteriophytochrome)
MHRDALDLAACDREPIHIPGSIQPHGLLLVVDPATDVVLRAAGAPAMLEAFGGSVPGKTVATVLGSPLADLVRDAETALSLEPAYLGCIGSVGAHEELAVVAHLVGGAAILEVEPRVPPPSAARTLASIRSATERIGGAVGLIEACELAAHEVSRITGYDRVMIYRFLADGSGSVIAEVKDDRLRPYLNHRFPASDIPKQARELYRRSTIRVIPDVGYAPAPLVPARAATEPPLDMSHCILRSVSPVHIRYLENMGVGASMSVSLLPDDDLWGLIACHNTTPQPVPYEAQETCRHVAQILSQHIRAREESDGHRIGRELAAARDTVMGALVKTDDPRRALLNLCPDLGRIVVAHGVAIRWQGTVATAGHAPAPSEVERLAAWLEARVAGLEVFDTDRLSEVYPTAKALTAVASGLLATILPGADPVTSMWFRAEQVEEINSRNAFY